MRRRGSRSPREAGYATPAQVRQVELNHLALALEKAGASYDFWQWLCHLPVWARLPYRQHNNDLPAPFHFIHYGLDLRTTTRADYEAGIRVAFDRNLRGYCDFMEQSARSSGLEKRDSKRNDEHYDWLARCLLGESQANIWRSALRNTRYRQRGDPSRQAVRQAIRKTADELGLDISAYLKTWQRRAPRSPSCHLSSKN